MEVTAAAAPDSRGWNNLPFVISCVCESDEKMWPRDELREAEWETGQNEGNIELD